MRTVLRAGDPNLVWRYVDFVLDRDSGEGVRVFTKTQASLDPSRVLHSLQRYPEVRLGFLHHLIDTKKLQASVVFKYVVREILYKL